MKQNNADYKVVPYPKMRRWMSAAYRSAQYKPMIHGLLEVDVTGARTFLRDHKAKTGESLSFTAFIIACLGKAIEEHKAVQAFRNGSKHLLMFDDVDGHIAIREYLCLTVSLDHDIIDGAPAARFTQQLKDLIESGYGLDDSIIELEQTIAPGASKKILSSSH